MNAKDKESPSIQTDKKPSQYDIIGWEQKISIVPLAMLIKLSEYFSSKQVLPRILKSILTPAYRKCQNIGRRPRAPHVMHTEETLQWMWIQFVHTYKPLPIVSIRLVHLLSGAVWCFILRTMEIQPSLRIICRTLAFDPRPRPPSQRYVWICTKYSAPSRTSHTEFTHICKCIASQTLLGTVCVCLCVLR